MPESARRKYRQARGAYCKEISKLWSQSKKWEQARCAWDTLDQAIWKHTSGRLGGGDDIAKKATDLLREEAAAFADLCEASRRACRAVEKSTAFYVDHMQEGDKCRGKDFSKMEGEAMKFMEAAIDGQNETTEAILAGWQ